MKETTRQLFARATDAIEAADILLANNKEDFAIRKAPQVLLLQMQRIMTLLAQSAHNATVSLPTQ